MANMVPVSSSNINAVGYDSEKSEMTVEFKSGGTYVYFNVDPSIHAQFVGSPSIGKFFHSNIRGQFESEKVG
jgi:hypothetical protein